MHSCGGFYQSIKIGFSLCALALICHMEAPQTCQPRSQGRLSCAVHFPFEVAVKPTSLCRPTVPAFPPLSTSRCAFVPAHKSHRSRLLFFALLLLFRAVALLFPSLVSADPPVPQPRSRGRLGLPSESWLRYLHPCCTRFLARCSSGVCSTSPSSRLR